MIETRKGILDDSLKDVRKWAPAARAEERLSITLALTVETLDEGRP